MIVPPTASRARLTRGWLVKESANPDTAIAITSEAIVIGMSYDRRIGSERASIPMKCMDQMPHPMATAPPKAHSRDWPLARATREDRPSAVYETNTATATDSRTSQWL